MGQHQSRRKHLSIAQPSQRMPSVVVIGGAKGACSIIEGLNRLLVIIKSVVSMSDNGGHTGLCRREHDVHPGGDVRRLLAAHAARNLKRNSGSTLVSQLLEFRFSQPGSHVDNCSLGNFLMLAVESLAGDFQRGINLLEELLCIPIGSVIPVTLTQNNLVGQLADGTVIFGETNLDVPKHDASIAIAKTWLEPAAAANPKAVEAIMGADVVLLGPGDLYTSIVPNGLVAGIPEAIAATSAKVVYISNIMTKHGETNGYKLSDFMRVIGQLFGGLDAIDMVFANDGTPPADQLLRYRDEGQELVEIDPKAYHLGPEIITGNFLCNDDNKLARHDSLSVVELIKEILFPELELMYA